MSASRLDVETDEQRQERIRRLLERTETSSNTGSSRTGPTATFPFVSFDTEHKIHAVDPPSDLLARVQAFLPQMEAANADLLFRAQANPQSVNIEHLDSADSQFIQMNLGLGVFDVRGPAVSRQNDADEDDEHRSASDSDTGSNADSEKQKQLHKSKSSNSAKNSDSDSESASSISHRRSSSSSSSSSYGSASTSSSKSAIGGEHELVPLSLSSASLGSLIPETLSVPVSQRPVRPLPKRCRPKIVVLGEHESRE